MELGDVLDQIQQIEDQLTSECAFITDPTQLRLDQRVGALYVDNVRTFIATKNNRLLSYYGGFEYIDREYVHTVGNFTIYSGEHERVQEALDHFALHQMESRRVELVEK